MRTAFSQPALFQIKKAIGRTGERDKTTAWNRCGACPGLMSAFLTETARNQLVARARLKTHPDNEDTLFFLGKVDPNYVWLQSGTLGRKTGWDEYWEAIVDRSIVCFERIQSTFARTSLAPGSITSSGRRFHEEFAGSSEAATRSVDSWSSARSSTRAAATSSCRRKPCSPFGTCRCANGKSQKPLSPRGCWPASSLRTATCVGS